MNKPFSLGISIIRMRLHSRFNFLNTVKTTMLTLNPFKYSCAKNIEKIYRFDLILKIHSRSLKEKRIAKSKSDIAVLQTI